MDEIWIDADLQDNSNLFCAAAIIDTVSCRQVEPSWDLDYLGVVDVQPPGISKNGISKTFSNSPAGHETRELRNSCSETHH